MNYWPWLLGISVAFALFERLRPARPGQPSLRPQLLNDLFYVAFNGHFYALLFGAWIAGVASWTQANVLPLLGYDSGSNLLSGRAFGIQFVIYLIGADFLQWLVHNLLHRVPWLWTFHKVHHSASRMDWAVNFRFHWMELIVYRTLLYLPLVFLGGDPDALFAAAVFATCWGHFNHSNLDLGLGPLGYVFNSPRMHMWHHDTSAEGGVSKNYGIVFSLWDYLFGTAYWPRERAPKRLGYPGDAEMPQQIWRQLTFPFARKALKS